MSDPVGKDVPARGIPCPRCGCCDLRTSRTLRVGRHIRRYKFCRHCGKRVVTCEQAIVKDGDTPQNYH